MMAGTMLLLSRTLSQRKKRSNCNGTSRSTWITRSLIKSRPEKIANSITTYGETLFKHVFDDSEIYAAYKSAQRSGFHSLQFEIVGSPGFHALHWEALKDPKLPHPLTLQASIVRKSQKPQVMPAKVHSSPTIKVLIVTARQFGSAM